MKLLRKSCVRMAPATEQPLVGTGDGDLRPWQGTRAVGGISPLSHARVCSPLWPRGEGKAVLNLKSNTMKNYIPNYITDHLRPHRPFECLRSRSERWRDRRGARHL